MRSLFLYFMGGFSLSTYLELANSVLVKNNNRLKSYDKSLVLIGTGRSAYVFRIESTSTAIKVFFPGYEHIAKEEAEIYAVLQDVDYFPSVYEHGRNYIVMEYIEGITLFECLTNGTVITSVHIQEVDYALSLASKAGLNPSDIHLRNILIDSNGDIKLIDVARYRQKKDCKQWSNLKRAHLQLYSKWYFVKKIPKPILNCMAFMYKKGFIPTYRSM